MIIIYSDASPHSLYEIKEVLANFYTISGLQDNYQKSVLFYGNVPLADQANLASLLGMKMGTSPVRYFGVPLI